MEIHLIEYFKGNFSGSDNYALNQLINLLSSKLVVGIGSFYI